MDLSTASATASALDSEDSKFTNPPRKVRSACNRCHSQKIRCVRKTGLLSCERCVRLKSICRYAPRAPRASLKPSEQSATGCIHEPTSVSASIATPIAPSDTVNADFDEDDWLFSPTAETVIAEGRGWFCHPCLRSLAARLICI
jgi:Fungal Zn(2)-Cys(6) binuclear cluster domain